MRKTVSPLVACSITAALVLAPAVPAFAADRSSNEQIVLSGPVQIARTQTSGDVIIFHGSASVMGRVAGDLVIFDGPAVIDGVVDRDVVALGGPVTLGPSALVKGDLVHRGTLHASPGSKVMGVTKLARPEEIGQRFRLFSRFAFWGAMSVSTFLLGLTLLLVAPRVAETLPGLARKHAARALGWGLVVFFGLPVLAIISFLTILGIPLGVLLLLGLFVLYPLGYTTSAVILGRTIRKPGSLAVAFLEGLVVLRVVALVPLLGGLASFAATLFGLGSIVIGLGSIRTAPPAPETETPAAVAANS